MTVGEKIKTLRKAMGFTQTEFGKKLGVQKNAVSKWECGQVEDVPRSKLNTMASIFGVTTSYLIDDEAAVPPVTEDFMSALQDHERFDREGQANFAVHGATVQ